MIIQQECGGAPLYRCGAGLFRGNSGREPRGLEPPPSVGATRFSPEAIATWATGNASSGTSDAFSSGLAITVEICASPCCAIVVGLLLCLMRMYVRPLVRAIGLIRVLRATPILVQLLWVTCVAGALGWPDPFSLRQVRSHCSQGILAETFRGGSRRYRAGSAKRPYSVGMPLLRLSANRLAAGFAEHRAPSLVNQFTVIVKSSTLVSVITVQDLMFQSQKIVNIWYEPIEILTATAAIYIAIVFLVSTAGKALADRLRYRYGIALA